MNRPRILFVDDEPAVMESLSDMLRKERRRWDMVFTSSGSSALDAIAKAPFDIVVTDMRMPGMDGSELLARVKAISPTTTRIVLSGHSDRDALMRSISVAHQFLSKPCDAIVLRSTIDRTHGLRVRIENDAVKAVVGRIDHLPSVPSTYLELTKLAADPTKGLADLARVIEKDTSMSAKVLQLVSSSYFGARREVKSIQQAIGLLGVDLLKGLTLTAHAFVAAQEIAIPGFSIERLQQFSMVCATAAKQMAPELADEVFTAALVHDIGKIVLGLGMPEEMARVHELASSAQEQLHDIEKQHLGVTHAEVGAYLLGLWGLPFPILEAVAYHHAPSSVREGQRTVLAIVHAADVLVDNLIDGGKDGQLDERFLADVGLADRLPAWRAIAEQCVQGLS